MQKSLQTKCQSNSQRCIQSDTLRDQTITSRRVCGTSSAWTWTSESGGAWILAVDEFSRHEAGALVVANRHGRWIRNPSKITSHFTAVRLHVRKNRKSVHRFPIFTALSCTPCISSVQLLYHLPVIKNFDLLHQNADFTVSQSTTCYLIESDHKEGSVSTTNRLRQSLDADGSMIQGKKRVPKPNTSR